MTEKEITGWGVDTSHKFLLIKHVWCLPKQPSAGSWPSSFSYLPCPNTQRVVVGAAAFTWKNNVHPQYLRRGWDDEALSTPLSLPRLESEEPACRALGYVTAVLWHNPQHQLEKWQFELGGRRGTGMAVRRAGWVFSINSSTIPSKWLLT